MSSGRERNAKGRFVPVAADTALQRGEIRLGSDGTAKMVAAKEDGFSPERQDRFFEALAETANVSSACEAAPVARSTVWTWRQRDAARGRGCGRAGDGLRIASSDDQLRDTGRLAFGWGDQRALQPVPGRRGCRVAGGDIDSADLIQPI
jgi:hypothetical protein